MSTENNQRPEGSPDGEVERPQERFVRYDEMTGLPVRPDSRRPVDQRSIDWTEDDRYAFARNEKTARRLQALADVQAEYRFQLPDSNDWRPTQREPGLITGFEHWGTLTIVATDGIEGVFVLLDNVTTMRLHTQKFTGKVAPLFAAAATGSGYSGPRKPAGQKGQRTVKSTKAQDLLAMLLGE